MGLGVFANEDDDDGWDELVSGPKDGDHVAGDWQAQVNGSGSLDGVVGSGDWKDLVCQPGSVKAGMTGLRGASNSSRGGKRRKNQRRH